MVVPTVFKPLSEGSIYSQIWVDGCKKLVMKEGCPSAFITHNICNYFSYIVQNNLHIMYKNSYIMCRTNLHIMYKHLHILCRTTGGKMITFDHFQSISSQK